MSELETAPLTAARLADLRRVLDPVCGGAGGCYCFNHHIPLGQPDVTGEAAWRGKAAEVSRGHARGQLAYLGGDPVGWVAVDPVGDVPGHDCVVGDPPGAWIVHCFVVVPAARGRGVAGALLAAAIEEAQRGGAEALLAYPVPAEAGLAFAGTPGLFARAGFTPAGEAPAPYLRYWRELA